MTVYVNDVRSATVITNDTLGSIGLTWAEAVFSWAEAEGTWAAPHGGFANDARSSTTITNDVRT